MASKKLGKCLVIGNCAANLLCYTEAIIKCYHIKTASTFDSSLDLLDDFEPDLIVIDELIPGSSAIEIASAIRSDDGIHNYFGIIIIADPTNKKIKQLREVSRSDFILAHRDADNLLLETCHGILRVKRLEDTIQAQKLALKAADARQRQISSIDPLTSLLNLPHLIKTLEAEFHRANRFDTPLTVLIVSIDEFPQMRQRCSYKACVMICEQVGRELQGLLRNEDHIGRGWGGNFICVLPETADEGAMILARRIQDRIQSRTYGIEDETYEITVSQGLGYFHPLKSRFTDKVELLKAAETNLNCAKDSGINSISHKNRVS